ncbi:MAG: hypothetical protein HC858_09950 [Brachymonas sp.]|nr:hypothetical protein [Brachymonas sp.]
MHFIKFQNYTRQQIHDTVGGDLQSYLPHRDGHVVCGCFDPALNARAPFEIDVGNSPDVIKYAERFVSQTDAVPIFLKRSSSEWEYVDDFHSVKLERSEEDLYAFKAFRRPDAVAVLYLAEKELMVESEIPPLDVNDTVADEGRKRYYTHYLRERSPILAEAKRRAFRAEHGLLYCEACTTSEDKFPPGLAESCFEVHHLRPLATNTGVVRTGLNDLAIVCANCHRMIHRSEPMLSPSDLLTELKNFQ